MTRSTLLLPSAKFTDDATEWGNSDVNTLSEQATDSQMVTCGTV